MNEMIERVARAICPGNPDLRVEARNCKNWEQYVNAARAAIAAMRGPTEAMVGAGQEENNLDETVGHFEFLSRDEMTAAYHAMIDAALKDA